MAASAKKEGKKIGIPGRIVRSVRDMRGEMKKVVWPTRQQTVNNTVIVLIFMLIMSIFIGGFDLGLQWLIRVIIGLIG